MPAHRDTVRRLAMALEDYALRFHDPHLASPRVKSDLAWAVSNRTDYVAPPETADSPAKARRKGKKKS